MNFVGTRFKSVIPRKLGAGIFGRMMFRIDSMSRTVQRHYFHMRESKWNGRGGEIRTLALEAWAGFSKRFDSVGMIAEGTCNNAESPAASQASPTRIDAAVGGSARHCLGFRFNV